MLLIFVYLSLTTPVGGTEVKTYQGNQTRHQPHFPKHFWLSLPHSFCANIDGLYIMQRPGTLTHFKDRNSTIISYQEEKGCWFVEHEGTPKVLRSCHLSYPAHPPGGGWVICMDSTCEDIKDHRGQIRLHPLSHEFSNQLLNPEPEITIHRDKHKNCSWANSTNNPQAMQG